MGSGALFSFHVSSLHGVSESSASEPYWLRATFLLHGYPITIFWPSANVEFADYLYLCRKITNSFSRMDSH